MSKKAHLEPYLNRDELKTRYLSAKDLVESRRWHLLWLVSLDWSIKKAAEIEASQKVWGDSPKVRGQR
ncbi:hypothetical protein P9B04_20465, partial [Crocosphaera sp. Alani8]